MEFSQGAGLEVLLFSAQGGDDDTFGICGPCVGDEFGLNRGVVSAGHIEDKA